MKYSLILVAGLALSACNLETPASTEAPPQTGTIGVQFAQIPVGTAFHYRASNGDTWANIYRGKQNGLYVMETTFVNAGVTRRTYHNADGLRVKSTGHHGRVDGLVTTFTPHRCARVLGTCQMTVRNTGPKQSSDTYTSVLKPSSNGYRFTAQKADGSDKHSSTFRLGQFNVHNYWSDGDWTERLVKVVTP